MYITEQQGKRVCDIQNLDFTSFFLIVIPQKLYSEAPRAEGARAELYVQENVVTYR